jgi:hypothetical protein
MPTSQENRGKSVMAATYKRSSRAQSKASGVGPFLVVAAAVVGLLAFVPGTATNLGDAVSAMISLPR